jgi:hypothetical protein
MPADAPRNIPVPDELAQVRDEMKRLETREAELRNLLIANPDIREGAAWLAEVKVSQRETTDIKEMRACHPDLVAEFTHALDVTRVVLSGIDADTGEIVSARQMRNKEKAT